MLKMVMVNSFPVYKISLLASSMLFNNIIVITTITLHFIDNYYDLCCCNMKRIYIISLEIYF